MAIWIIRINPKIRIRISYGITFVSSFGIGGGLRALVYNLVYYIILYDSEKLTYILVDGCCHNDQQ